MPQKLRSGGNVVLNWSPNLENAEKLPRPELTRIFSNSRTGRTDWHRNQFVPLPSRPPPEKPPVEYVAPQHRRHLIYLALYRDKVDQHQAAMLAATTGGAPSGPSQLPEAAQSLAATTGHFPVEEGSLESRRSQTLAHTAAVKASGIGLDEHVEVKRLGKLFDEWIEMTKQDVDEVYEKLGLNREGAKTLRPNGRAVRPGRKNTKTVRGGRTDVRSPSRSGYPPVQEMQDTTPLEATASATATTTFGAMSQGSMPSPRRLNPDRKKLERLWTVLTNPKVRCASLTDKAGYERDRLMPRHIEGIKPLMLYKLYNGPWRLDV